MSAPDADSFVEGYVAALHDQTYFPQVAEGICAQFPGHRESHREAEV
jgi:hypothetical protein